MIETLALLLALVSASLLTAVCFLIAEARKLHKDSHATLDRTKALIEGIQSVHNAQAASLAVLERKVEESRLQAVFGQGPKR